MKHAKALAQLGEIDGITLRINNEGKATVVLEIDGKEYVAISTFHGGMTDHHITRRGLINVVNKVGIDPHD